MVSPAYLSWLYGAALLLAALLLFSIQPLFTRMALPYFGGAPAVWTTAAMFFQFALLAGYLYAHVLSRSLEFRRQVAVHVALLALVFLQLPVAIDSAASAAAGEAPIATLLRLLLTGLGLPFFAIAATAPLLQRWFSETRHEDAGDPYFLYVASNVGSMGALLLYPALVEPTLYLQQQTFYWAIAYIVLAGLVLLCGWMALSAPARTAAPIDEEARTKVAEAEAFARAGAEPSPEIIETQMWANGGSSWRSDRA